MTSVRSDYLDLLDFFWLQTKTEVVEIRVHVVRAGGPRQWDHAVLDREPEDNLWNGSTVAGRDPRYFG